MNMSSKSIVLPPAVRRRVAKLPDASRDIVAQQLRNPPTIPIVYEDAIKFLSSVRDIDIGKGILHAAEGLALWGKIHDDNRAVFEAQKLKAHALRQLFICAKMLGEPYEVLLDKKIYQSKAKRGEELASFPDKIEIDAIADELCGKVRAEFLVGKIAERSPLFRSVIEERNREQEERRQADAKTGNHLRKPSDIYIQDVIAPLLSAGSRISEVASFDFRQFTAANKRVIREKISEIMDWLDKIDEACK